MSLDEQIRVVHGYWLRTFGAYPDREECACIVATLAALEEDDVSFVVPVRVVRARAG
jgi:hypothetical protein